MKCDKCGYDDHGTGDTAHVCGTVNIKKVPLPMNIYIVRDNLKNTIAGKEKMLDDYRKARELATSTEDIALYATVEFLKANIDELKRILADVEVCCKQASEASWATNPDRSGGQFTQDEIYNINRSDWIEP